MRRGPNPKDVWSNRRLATSTFLGSAGPNIGTIRIADPKGFREAVCRRLAARNIFLEWDGEKLTTVHYRKTQKSTRRQRFVSTAGRSLAYVDEQLARHRQEESDRGVSVSELLEMTAQQIGISYSTLHRITHSTSKTVDWRTFWLLQEYLRDTEDNLLLKHALTPEVWRARREYAAYVLREFRRFNQKRYAKHDVVPVGPERLLWERFQTQALKLGADGRRIRLGQLRVYDVVIGWRRIRREIDSAGLKGLLKQGYSRELNLIKLEHRILLPKLSPA